MKKIIFFALIIATGAITLMQCTKKSDGTPAPSAPAANTLTITGSGTESLTVAAGTDSGSYALTGTPASGNYVLDVTFPGGRPTSNSSVNLGVSNSSLIISISNTTSSGIWIAASGSAYIGVKNDSTTVTFVGVTFIGTSAITASGSITGN